MLEDMSISNSLIGIALSAVPLTGLFYFAEKISESFGNRGANKQRLMHLYDEEILKTRPTIFNSNRLSRFYDDMGIKY